MPTLKEYFYEEVTGFGAVKVDPHLEIEEFFYEKGHPIFGSLPERPTTDCRRSVEDPLGTVRADFDGEGLVLRLYNIDESVMRSIVVKLEYEAVAKAQVAEEAPAAAAEEATEEVAE